MSQAVQTVKEIFTSQVLPILEKWGYSVLLEESDPTEVKWIIRWGDMQDYVSVRYREETKPRCLEIRGGFYCSLSDPTTLDKKRIFQRLRRAVEAAIVRLSREELDTLYSYSKGVLERYWWKTRTTEWVTNGYLYSCTLHISLSRRPTWRWICKVTKFAPYTYCPFSELCRLTPTDEIVNPTEAFLRLERAILAQALL